MGGDFFIVIFLSLLFIFQSTPPVWVVTEQQLQNLVQNFISIHTTRVGGDFDEIDTLEEVEKISIHTTRVGGDSLNRCCQNILQISIHTTRVGGDVDSINLTV